MMTNSLVKYETTFESTNNLPMNVEIGHGESADLIATFKDGGIPVALSGYTAMAIYQPSSKWGTDEWYECPCEIVDNAVAVHWNYESDNGDNAVKLFIYATKGNEVAYPAIYQLRLFATPGFDPHPITPTPKILDFNQYTLLNAPWVPLSGNVSITGDLTMDDSDITHRMERTATMKNIRYLNDTEYYFLGNVIVSFDSIYLDELIHISDIEIPVRITGTQKTTGETKTIDAILSSPYVDQTETEKIIWSIVADGDNIGLLSFSEFRGQTYVRSGQIFTDYMISGSFVEDTSEQTIDSKDYIYDDMRYATKTELRHLEALVNSILSSLNQ